MGSVGGLDFGGGVGFGLLGEMDGDGDLGCFRGGLDGNSGGIGMGWRGRVVIMESVCDSGGRGREKAGFARVFHGRVICQKGTASE